MTAASDSVEDYERINSALDAMSSHPRSLLRYLGKPGPDFEQLGEEKQRALFELLLSSDENSPARLKFANLLRGWDNAKDPKWGNGESRNSADRRQRIHHWLALPDALLQRVDKAIPFFQIEEPLLIAKDHTDWYNPQPGVKDYYWSTYKRYLKAKKDWRDESIIDLENSTRAIVECLANPAQKQAYASRGLVVGYVQSGKTANFTGVVARAADAGYRLIIVLAGTWNILRTQTQRRFDKELLAGC